MKNCLAGILAALLAYGVIPFSLQAQSDQPVERPYTQEDVRFRHGDVELAGTLTLPAAPAPYPAVVLLSGSGAQTRDSELFGFKLFARIADALTRNGIAVLRFDDRGVGGSSGDVATATAMDLAGDALAAVTLLETRSDIARGNIGLLGHSEGGTVAPLAAASSNRVAFIVLVAAPALPGKEILYLQGEHIVRANGGTDLDVRNQRDVQDVIFKAVESNSGWHWASASIEGQLRSEIDRLPPERRAAIPNVESYVFGQLATQMNQITSPWFRSFLEYDPREPLRNIHVPVLALFAELDTQVPPSENAAAMRHALIQGGHDRFLIHTVMGANHLFAPARSGSPMEYPSLEKRFVPGFLETIADWILSESR